MVCANCGTQINDQMKFCPECGTPVPEVIREEEIKTESTVLPMCSQCGKQLKPEARFCPACGIKIEETIQNAQSKIEEQITRESRPTLENQPIEETETENSSSVMENKSDAGNEIKEKTACRKIKVITPSGSFEISDKIAESAFKGGYKIEIYKNENLIAYMDTNITEET